MSEAEIEPRDEEGKTPAAWTTVWIMLIAFAVGTLGIAIYNWPLFFVGVAIFILGAVVGKVMAAMGYGQYPKGKHPEPAA